MSGMLPCKICGARTDDLGAKQGGFKREMFVLRRCRRCGFAFIANPWTDYQAIYSDAYYAGEGADPLVDYLFELEHPEHTVRHYEWRGILTAVNSLVALTPSTYWLDFGCGNGGLVRYCRNAAPCRIVGFEQGAIRSKAVEHGIPLIEEREMLTLRGAFDIVTAIEVLEHVEDPIHVLREMRALLKPGGLLFCTTGNPQPHRKRLIQWRYIIPESHISFFEPESLRLALEQTGFQPESRGFLPGFTDIIRFKILKNLHVRHRSAWERTLPWAPLTRLVDWRLKITAHPIAWARPD
jgi:SAM-dependent methyltransferase